jgi:hypothetical protein
MENPIDLEDVKRVYSGKSDTCYCGCSGSYWYPDEGTTYGRIKEEISLAKVKRIVNKLNKNISQVEKIVGMDEDIYTLTVGKHDYTVYCHKFNNLRYLEKKWLEKQKGK